MPHFIYIIIALAIVLCAHLFLNNSAASGRDCFLTLKHQMTLFLVGLLGGFFWVLLFVSIQLSQILPQNLEGKTLQVAGRIVSLPERKDHAIKFTFHITTLNGFHDNHRVLLNWYGATPNLLPGDQWSLAVRLKRPHGFANPGSFDYEAYLFSHRIGATGYVVSAENNRLLNHARYHQLLNRWRGRIQNKIVQLTQDQLLWQLLPALVVGSRQFVTAEQWTVLQQTGTNHLIAIAGLHIGLIAGFIFFLIRWIWRCIPFLALRIPDQVAASCFSLFTAIIYASMAGFPVQTQRALIMLSVVLFSLMLRRITLSLSVFCYALLLVLILNPLSVMDVGFWLSFVAVGTIFYAMKGRIHISWQWIRVQWVIMLGLFPWMLWFFQQVSLASVLANMIVVPWFGVVIMPCVLFGAVSLLFSSILSRWLFYVALKNLQLIWILLKFMARFNYILLIHLAILHLWILFSLVLAVILLLMPKGFSGRYLASFFLLPLVFVFPKNISYGNMRFTLLDVGQGLSSVVETQHHVLVFDTGPKMSPDFDTGAAVVVPYLRQMHISTIDLLMISHLDNDHIGGAQSIILSMPVSQVMSSARLPFDVNNFQYCHRGERWNWDGVKFEVLSPMQNKIYLGNNSSCVLHVMAKNQRVLLTGDIEKPAEKTLLSENLKSTILVAPHHGSITSSTQKFVLAVDPSDVFFPIGYRNRFRFPSVVVKRRYQGVGAKTYDTAYSGAIEIYTDLNLYRFSHHHLWGFDVTH